MNYNMKKIKNINVSINEDGKTVELKGIFTNEEGEDMSFNYFKVDLSDITVDKVNREVFIKLRSDDEDTLCTFGVIENNENDTTGI